MTPPTTLIIGPLAYTVESPDKPIIHEGSGRVLWGECRSAEQRILINADAPRDRARVTLIHEVLHAIDDIWGIDLTEEQITDLSWGIAQYLGDNPNGGGWLP